MLNKVTLIGRLGADPEVRYIPNGGAVANIRLATSRRWKDKQTGDKREETEWHRVIFFSRLAEISAEFLKKGSQVYIEGRIQTQKWQDKGGQDKYTTEIIAEQMQMLGSKNSAQAETTSPNMSNLTPSSSTTIDDEFDDDIPFF